MEFEPSFDAAKTTPNGGTKDTESPIMDKSKKYESGEAGSSRVIHLVLDLSGDPGFLNTAPVAQPVPGVDPYSLKDTSSKDDGCCSWRARIKRFVFCSCCKGDNTVAAGAEDNAGTPTPAQAGETSRKRRSSNNFFWNGETGYPNEPDKNRISNGKSHRGKRNKSNQRGNNAETPLRHYNPQEARPYEGVSEAGVSLPEELQGTNHGRWIRQSDERREALRRARNAEERARAANNISGMDAFLISNAMMNSGIMADTNASSNEGRGSEGSIPSADPPAGGDFTEG